MTRQGGKKKGFCRLMLKKLLFTLCLTVLVMLSASAEEIPVYDFREDQASYAALSAEMTRRKADAPLLRAAGGSGTGTAVLCAVREGAELPFEELDMPPQCVLAGPGGRYTLMYRSEQQAERAAGQLSLMPGVRYAEAAYQALYRDCLGRGIALYDMYGLDEIRLHRKAADYPLFSRVDLEQWRAKLTAYDLIVLEAIQFLLA